MAAQRRASKSSASDAGAAAWERALRWLAARERSTHELQLRLEAAGFSKAQIAATLRRLGNAGYLDDRRCAQQLTESLHRRGHGSLRARHEMEMRGIATPIIEATIAAVYDDEPALARAVLAQRFGARTGTASERQAAQAARFLAARGFSEDVVLAIMEQGC